LFAYSPADATAIPKPHILFCLVKIQNVLSFWYRLTPIVLEKNVVKGMLTLNC